MSENRVMKRFLYLSVISSVGNSCADWALFFYALDKTSFGMESGTSKASLYFLGFGVGRMIFGTAIRGSFLIAYLKKL